MHLAAFGLFAAALIVCVILNVSVIYALLAGLLIFSLCAFKMGYGAKSIFKMMLDGIKTAKNVILSLILIGMLTALWRAAGTIPAIISYAASLIHPKTVVLMSFILNCGVSLLTGTAFGTAATMGVISMTMGIAMGADPVLLGGAIVSGAYFGDRASPMSTSALLVSELTETNVFSNIRGMLRRSLIPFIVCCVLYTLAGISLHSGGDVPDLSDLFLQELQLHWLCLIPAVLVIVMSVFKIRVQITMTTIIVSSTYAGIFSGTGMLGEIRERIQALSRKISAFGAVLVTSAMASVISCNQTLAIMLTHQLCRNTENDRQRLALYIEDTAIVLPALIPWSIAASVPLDSIGAPISGLLAASFLYILPFYSMLKAVKENKHEKMPL